MILDLASLRDEEVMSLLLRVETEVEAREIEDEMARRSLLRDYASVLDWRSRNPLTLRSREAS